MGIYADPDLLHFVEDQWDADAFGKLNMGKGCVRFKKADRLLAAMPLLGQLFEQMSPEAWIARYEGTFKR